MAGAGPDVRDERSRPKPKAAPARGTLAVIVDDIEDEDDAASDMDRARGQRVFGAFSN